MIALGRRRVGRRGHRRRAVLRVPGWPLMITIIILIVIVILIMIRIPVIIDKPTNGHLNKYMHK